jgi:hypothetical protein
LHIIHLYTDFSIWKNSYILIRYCGHGRLGWEREGVLAGGRKGLMTAYVLSWVGGCKRDYLCDDGTGYEGHLHSGR